MVCRQPQLGLKPGSANHQLHCPEPRLPSLHLVTLTPQCRGPRKHQMLVHPEPGPQALPHLPGSGTGLPTCDEDKRGEAGEGRDVYHQAVCREREKAKMLSIQSPKPRAHCRRCSTRPEQKMSFPSAGLDLAGWVQTAVKRAGRAERESAGQGLSTQWDTHR